MPLSLIEELLQTRHLTSRVLKTKGVPELVLDVCFETRLVLGSPQTRFVEF
jgi:hypothetical protein